MLGSVRTHFARHWRVIVFIAVAFAALATTLVTTGVGAAAPLVVTALSAILLRTGTGKTPRPRLDLRVLHEPPLWPATESARSVGELFGHAPDSWAPAPPARGGRTVVGRCRPLDSDVLVEDAVRSARAQVPADTALSATAEWGNQYAAPTADDHEHFEAHVDEYADELRAWLADVDAFLTDRARIFVAQPVQTNPADIDANDTHIVVSFPAGFEPVAELPEVPQAPSPPRFPRRRSALSLAMRGYEHAMPRFERPIMQVARDRAIRLSFWTPGYTRVDGALEVDYPRQTIRHGEDDVSGDPFMLRCPDSGDQDVAWEIHAANLPSFVGGTWTITCVTETTGDPVRTMVDLQELLAHLSPNDDAHDE